MLSLQVGKLMAERVLPSREQLLSITPGHLDEMHEWHRAIVVAVIEGRLVDREAMMEGIVTATGNNTMLGHGEQGPWAHVTIYGDYEPFDTMLVTPLEGSDG